MDGYQLHSTVIEEYGSLRPQRASWIYLARIWFYLQQLRKSNPARFEPLPATVNSCRMQVCPGKPAQGTNVTVHSHIVEEETVILLDNRLAEDSLAAHVGCSYIPDGMER
ncbi:MAG: hypothetical protein ABSC77_03905 [Terracidiphilus sp.]|jgi:hypothetical protein